MRRAVTEVVGAVTVIERARIKIRGAETKIEGEVTVTERAVTEIKT